MAAEIVTLIAGLVPAVLEVGKCFKKHFNYLCCLKTNIHDLEVAAKDLEDKEADLHERVEGATRNGERTSQEVETWLTKAVETQSKKRQIIDTPTPGILNLKSRYSLSRNAMKTAESMVELRDTIPKSDRLSIPPLTPSELPTAPPSGAHEFASRKQIEDSIIEAMRDEQVKVIGVCGMGGVGKTMMAKQIMNRAGPEKEGLFEQVVMVAVGQQGDLLKIQRDIGDWLGMTKFEEETLAPRANRLRARLMADGKRKLVVIDDIWERIDLEELGIPCHESGLCKVLFTSRDWDNVGNAQRVFTVEILNDNEAWSMFKENVGDCLDDHSNLLPIAREVVKECNGLPLALVAVARALKGNKGSLNKRIWSHVLKQLRSANPKDIPGVIKDVYNSIRLSHDFLENEENAKSLKSLWFLCSLLPEDYNISLEDLAYFEFGLGSFDDHGINNLEESRDKVAMLIGTLKSRFLILDGKDKNHVKMHDVVRDVAIFIASEEKHDILHFSTMDCLSRRNPHSENCNMLSVVLKERVIELSMELSFPTLSFLWMDVPIFRQLQLSGHFFKGMQQLRVLYMNCFSFAKTPQTIQLLKNLRTLHLCSCYMPSETLSVVGELSSLEIFICRHCHSITELPMEIERLNRLILLEVTDCRSLKKIIPGLISKLVRLEELKMLSSFRGWESDKKGNDRSNVSLSELESLCNLKCLEIEIEDWSLATEKLEFSSKIENYTIFVGERKNRLSRYPTQEYNNTLILNFPMENSLSLGNWIHELARGAKTLSLEGGASQILDFASITHNTTCLTIDGCTAVKKFVVFPVLVELNLMLLPNLEEIFYEQQITGGLTNSLGKLNEIEFINLRKIHIWKCGKLRSLFSSSILIKSLSYLQIETLHINGCGSMEEVFSIELEEKDCGKSACITFPKLKCLSLANLESLTTFCKGIHCGIINIEFPLLDELRIQYCPKFISFINIGAADESHMSSSSSASAAHHLFCNTTKHQITFGSLKELTIKGYENDAKYLWCQHIPHSFFAGLEKLSIYGCGNVYNLFSHSVAGNLVNLKTLYIGECKEMVYVIGDGINTETTAETNPQISIFHKLEDLWLSSLPKLQCFSNGKRELQSPSHACSAHNDNIHLFCNQKITFDSLKYLSISKYDKDIKYLWCYHIRHPNIFDGLVKLRMTDCCNIHNLFSYSIAKNFVNLKSLDIIRCNEMVYVISDDINTATRFETKPQVLIFHKLEWLVLEGLPKLQSFCESKCDLQFPSLREIHISEWGSQSTPNMDDSGSAHDVNGVFFNTKITFGSLKRLTIEGYEKDISYLWCHHIPHPSLFAGLEELGISKCANIIKLFSYSIAGYLVDLKVLCIRECNEMVYVIDDDIINTNAETISETNPQILFPELGRVELWRLPKLQSFSKGKCDLQFPFLSSVEIDECPRLEGFTMGSLITPNMKKFQMNRQMKNVEDLSIYPWV